MSPGNSPTGHSRDRRVAGCLQDPSCVRVEHLSLTKDAEQTPPRPVRDRAARGSGTKHELRPGVWKLSVGHQGVRRHRTFRGTEPQATRALAEFADEIRLTGRRVAPTLDSLILGYLDHLDESGGHSPRTLGRYRSLHRHWVLPRIGCIQLRRLWEDDIEACLDAMAAAGQSQSSIRQTKALLAGAYRWGQRNGLVHDNPTQDIAWPWERTTPQPRRA